jgi:hypothetical protein
LKELLNQIYYAETRTSGVVLKTEPILEKVLRMQQKNIALESGTIFEDIAQAVMLSHQKERHWW